MSVSVLEYPPLSSPGYLGGGLVRVPCGEDGLDRLVLSGRLLEGAGRASLASADGGGLSAIKAFAASSGMTLLSTMSLFPLMSPLLLSSFVLSNGSAIFSLDMYGGGGPLPPPPLLGVVL